MWVPGRTRQRGQPVQRHLDGYSLSHSQQGAWCGCTGGMREKGVVIYDIRELAGTGACGALTVMEWT